MIEPCAFRECLYVGFPCDSNKIASPYPSESTVTPCFSYIVACVANLFPRGLSSSLFLGNELAACFSRRKLGREQKVGEEG